MKLPVANRILVWRIRLEVTKYVVTALICCGLAARMALFAWFDHLQEFVFFKKKFSSKNICQPNCLPAKSLNGTLSHKSKMCCPKHNTRVAALNRFSSQSQFQHANQQAFSKNLRSDISNMRDSVSSGYQNTEKRVKNTMHSGNEI